MSRLYISKHAQERLRERFGFAGDDSTAQKVLCWAFHHSRLFKSHSTIESVRVVMIELAGKMQKMYLSVKYDESQDADVLKSVMDQKNMEGQVWHQFESVMLAKA